MATDTASNDITVAGIVTLPQRDVILILEAGYLYMELGKNKEAEEVFQGAAALVPHSEVPHMALGHLYFSQGHFSPALKAHQKAATLNADSAAAQASVGEVMLFLKKNKEALKALDKAIALEPEGPAGSFARALKEAHTMGIFG